ncbi:MAG: hypothetical protein AAGC53_14250 [Actinomycetota bacterium]
MFPGFWLLFAVMEDPGTLLYGRMRASTIVLGLPLLALGTYQLVRPPMVSLEGDRLVGKTPSMGRVDWDLREVDRFCVGSRFSVSFIERDLPPAANGKGIRRLYVDEQAMSAIVAVLRRNGWSEETV